MTPDPELLSTINDAEVMTLIRWRDRRIDDCGHDARSTYVEQFWLGTLGPSTTLLLRHCATLLDGTDSTAANLRDTASTLGLGHEGGSRSALSRTISRACRFRTARFVGSATLAVRVRLPQLSRRQLARLPKEAQRRHEEFVTTDLTQDAVRQQQPRARRLAAGLIECGDSIDQAERQLALMSLHPAVVAEAVRWAWSLHHGQPAREAA